VLVAIEENHGYSDIIGSPAAPYINSLAQQGALFTNSHGNEHPSQPNYLDLFSGSNQGITNDSCPHTFSTQNLGSELIAAGLGFAGYSEDLPSIGSTVCSSGYYARKHNPWVNFTNVPSADNLPFTSYPSDYSILPPLSFVIPNQLHDMHDGTIAQADAWLQQFLDPYVQWARTHNSLFILTWDEDDFTSSNWIPTIFVGPMVTTGQYSEQINHFNMLRTMEDMFDLPHAGGSGSVLPIVDVWVTGTGTPTAIPTASATATTPPASTATHTPTGEPSNTPRPSDTPTGLLSDTATATITPTGTPVVPTPAETITVAATPTLCPVSFSDVGPADYFYSAVRYLYCQGAISGYADGTFRPFNNTTRGQLCKIVVLAMGFAINVENGPHFSDVQPADTFYQFVETAFNNTLIAGYADGTFRPGNNITRGQLSKIIVLAAGWTATCQGTGHFSDVPPDSTFFCFVETAYEHAVISGYADGTFRPGSNATRGQICKIVYSALGTP
jgi:hypothetical protein